MFDPKRKWVLLFGFAFFVLPIVPAAVGADTSAVCLIGDHPGIPESDAQTAALLVCDELPKQGISITDPVYEAPVSVNAYRVVLCRLAEKIIVRLSHENPIGTIIAERQLTLASIEEMTPAAPRLVDALVHDKPIDNTVDMETVTEQEARELRKISGGVFGHLKIFGTLVPGTDIAAGPGYGWGLSYQTPSCAVGINFQFLIREYRDDRDDFYFLSGGISGRYFFNKQNISPYVGGGFARYAGDIIFVSESNSGSGAYGVIGIEALRLTRSRLNLELRIDRPPFRLGGQDTMPITFGISYSLGGCLF